MAKRSGDRPVTVSILDRLLDDELGIRAEAPMSRSESMRALRTAVRRDIEWLLNTRRPLEQGPDGTRYLPHSLYNYGLPDITSMSLGSATDRDRLATYMEDAIAAFEPRLGNVRVQFRQGQDDKSHLLRFQIEGYLKVDPAPEYISFDTVLEVTNGEYDVRDDAGAR